MKQHITPEQLNELSEKGRERLRAWWQPVEGDLICVLKSNSAYEEKGEYFLFEDKDTNCGLFINYTNETFYPGATSIKELVSHLPLLSIGQMIEFLADHELPKFSFDGGNAVMWTGMDRRRKERFESAYTLCDLLWSAVKELLNGNSKTDSG